MLSGAFSPFGQFYLAWVGLVPWILVLGSTRSWFRAALWGGLGGLLFNAISISWLFRATVPGAIGLILYLSLFWSLAAAVVKLLKFETAWRPLGVFASVFTFALIWTGTEWFRGYLFGGIAWMYFGISQTPVLAMCQVADLGGVFAVSFWLAAINAAVAMIFLLPRDQRANLTGAFAAVAALLAIVFGYGVWRMSQRDALRPGPRVMIVQPNFPHLRGGAKTVTWEQQADYHFANTERALSEDNAIDLVVWSETVMPPMNIEARRKAKDPRLSHGIHDALVSLANRYRTSVLFGAYALVKFEGSERDADIRNSAYLYAHDQRQQPRYDKVHLVPYGESVPFRYSIRWLHNLLFKLAGYAVDYLITPGPADQLTVFDIAARDGSETSRCVTPICFEDVDGALVARMFRNDTSRMKPGKRAEFIVNLSNDGWFRGTMRRQHLQNAIFRSIENRAPTARACNTGISCFIDSIGRIDEATMMPEDTSGERVGQLMLDDRFTFYTQYGDVFGGGCAIVTALMLTYSLSPYSGRGRG